MAVSNLADLVHQNNLALFKSIKRDAAAIRKVRARQRKVSGRTRRETSSGLLKWFRRVRRLPYPKEWHTAKRREEYARAKRNPRNVICDRVRGRVRAVLNRRNFKKLGKTFEALGWTPEMLVAHLERQFSKGMSWANFGEWHIDHIVPLASFQFSGLNDPEFKAAWALTNLRPLWGTENIQKGSRRTLLL